MNRTESMSRTEFIRSLGLGSGALMALYCMGTLSSCTNSDPQPSTGTGTGTGTTPGSTKLDFTLNLDDSANSALKSSTAFLINGNVIVARTGTNTYVALSKTCTHEGTQIKYQAAQNNFHCDNHGSNFSTTGAVINGPATVALKQYSTTLTGSSLRVFES